MSSLSDSRETAVLLIAHGSRRSDANQDLVELAQQLRMRSGYAIVEASYLELAEPTIEQGGRACVEQGARRVMLLPYFLSAGTHVTADLERIRAELAAAHPSVEFRLCPPLGLHPLMVQIVLDRLADGLEGA
jgi:sirohydrochlorin ferrochelatase